MKVYAYCFWKTNNKVQPNLLDGGALRMRCAHKMRQVRFLCWDWETSGHFALALQSSSLSVSSRSRAPGPWKPGLHYALVLLVPFGSCDLGEAVSTPLKSPFSLLFTLSKHLASLPGHDLPLKPVCICFVPSSHPFLTLNHVCKFFSFETPQRSFSSSLQVYSRNFINVVYYTKVPNSYKPARSASPQKELRAVPSTPNKIWWPHVSPEVSLQQGCQCFHRSYCLFSIHY